MSTRQEQILDAAAQLLAESGPGGVSVRAVAARAGVGASTLRYYFPSQAQLFEALQARELDRRVGDLDIHDRSLPPAQRLAACLAQFLPVLPGKDTELALAPAGVAATPSVAAHLAAAMSVRARERVMYWLGVLFAEGTLRHRDPAQLATMLLAAVNGLCLEIVSPLGLTTPQMAQEILADLIERTVLAPPVFQGSAPRLTWRTVGATPQLG